MMLDLSVKKSKHSEWYLNVKSFASKLVPPWGKPLWYFRFYLKQIQISPIENIRTRNSNVAVPGSWLLLQYYEVLQYEHMTQHCAAQLFLLICDTVLLPKHITRDEVTRRLLLAWFGSVERMMKPWKWQLTASCAVKSSYLPYRTRTKFNERWSKRYVRFTSNTIKNSNTSNEGQVTHWLCNDTNHMKYFRFLKYTKVTECSTSLPGVVLICISGVPSH